jgi:molybdopterin converting factor small subunit
MKIRTLEEWYADEDTYGGWEMCRINELKKVIKDLRKYYQKEYDKLSKDAYEDNIQRVAEIRTLNKLLEELNI